MPKEHNKVLEYNHGKNQFAVEFEMFNKKAAFLSKSTRKILHEKKR